MLRSMTSFRTLRNQRKKVASLLLCAFFTTACEVRWNFYRCGPGSFDYCFTVSIIFDNPSDVSASSLVVTREADPAVFDYTGSVTPTGAVVVTLQDGTTRSWSGNLAYDSSESSAIGPATAGYRVFAFRPADPASLQQFIDMYKNLAQSVEVTTDVTLTELSDALTAVDAQGKRSSSVEYIGSVSVDTRDSGGGQNPPRI